MDNIENIAAARRARTAQEIRDALRESGMSRKEFADRMHRLPSEVTKWLSGNHNFTTNLLAEISYVFDTAISGASGKTYSEIAETLGFKDCSPEDIGSYYRRSLEAMAPADDSCKLNIANAIWVDRLLHPYEQYVSATEMYYSTKVTELDLSAPASIDCINSWVKENTDGIVACDAQEAVYKIYPPPRYWSCPACPSS